jgi:hypothetical protein
MRVVQSHNKNLCLEQKGGVPSLYGRLNFAGRLLNPTDPFAFRQEGENREVIVSRFETPCYKAIILPLQSVWLNAQKLSTEYNFQGFHILTVWENIFSKTGRLSRERRDDP